MKTGFFIVLLVLLVSAPMHAQDSLAAPARFWVGLSYGSATGKNVSGNMVSYSLSFARNLQVYSFRLLTVRSSSFAVPASDFESPVKAFGGVLEAGVLYGLNLRKKLFAFSASAGIGYVWGDIHSRPSAPSGTWGFPFDVQLGFNPTPVIGISLQVFGNINSQVPFDGSMVCLNIGKLW